MPRTSPKRARSNSKRGQNQSKRGKSQSKRDKSNRGNLTQSMYENRFRSSPGNHHDMCFVSGRIPDTGESLYQKANILYEKNSLTLDPVNPIDIQHIYGSLIDHDMPTLVLSLDRHGEHEHFVEKYMSNMLKTVFVFIQLMRTKSLNARVRIYLSASIVDYRFEPLSPTFQNGFTLFTSLDVILEKRMRFSLNKVLNKIPNTLIQALQKLGGDNIEIFSYNAKGDLFAQCARFLVLRAKPPVKHCIFLDAHSGCPSDPDIDMMIEMNKLCRLTKQKVFLIPSNVNYYGWWHGLQYDPYLLRLNRKSPIASHIQMCNFNVDEEWLTERDYVCSIGLMFKSEYQIRDTNSLSRTLGGKIVDDYLYGADEYVLSAFNEMLNIQKYNVLYKYFEFTDNSISHAVIHDSMHLLANYLFPSNIKVKRRELFLALEKKRMIVPNLKTEVDLCLSLLLAIVPNKYQWRMLYASPYADQGPRFDDEFEITEHSEISFETLHQKKIFCTYTLLSSSSYTSQVTDVNSICHPSDYVSGFYTVPLPKFSLHSIRRPSDIAFCLQNKPLQLHFPFLKVRTFDEFREGGDFTDKIRALFSIEDQSVIETLAGRYAIMKNQMPSFYPILQGAYVQKYFYLYPVYLETLSRNIGT